MNLMSSVFIGAGVRIANALVQFLLNLAIAGRLGSSLYGQYIYCVGLPQIISIPITTGINQVLVRKSQHSYLNEKPTVCLAALLSVCIYLTTVAPVIFIVVVFLTEGAWQRAFSIKIVVAAVIVQCLFQVVPIIYNIRDQLEKWQLKSLLFVSLPSAILLICLLIFSNEILIVDWLIAVQILVPLCFVAFNRMSFRLSASSLKQSWLVLEENWRPMLVIAAGGFLSITASQLDILLLPKLADAATLGDFRVASRIGGIGILALQFIEPLILVKAGQAYNGGDKVRGMDIYLKLTFIAVVASVICALGAYLFGSHIVNAMGYGNQRLPLAITVMAISNVFVCGLYPSMSMLMVQGRVRTIMQTIVLHLSVLMASYFIFVPAFGILGAAIAYHIAAWTYFYPVWRASQLM